MTNVLVLYLCAILSIFAVVKADVCELGDRTLLVGETYLPPGRCEELKCLANNLIGTTTCGSGIASGKSCEYVPQDNSKPFPSCCSTYICSEI